MKKIALACLLALSLSARAGAQSFFPPYPIPIPAAQGGVPNLPVPANGGITQVVGFGDSITYAIGISGVTCSTGTSYHTPTGNCYIDQVASYYGAQVANLGVPGTCLELTASPGYCFTEGNSGFSRYSNANTAGSPGFNGVLTPIGSTLVVITYGTNDVIHTDSGASPQLFQTQLQTIISYVLAQGIPANHIILGSIPYTNYQGPVLGNSPAFYAEVGTDIAVTAATNLVSYADYVAATAACWPNNNAVFGTACSSDGLHPNATGMPLFASAVENATYQRAIGGYGSFESLISAWAMPSGITAFPQTVNFAGGFTCTGCSLTAGTNIAVTGTYPNNTVSTVTNPTFSGNVTLGTPGTDDNGALYISNSNAGGAATRLAVVSAASVNGVLCTLYCFLQDGIAYYVSVDNTGNMGIAGGLHLVDGNSFVTSTAGTGTNVFGFGTLGTTSNTSQRFAINTIGAGYQVIQSYGNGAVVSGITGQLLALKYATSGTFESPVGTTNAMTLDLLGDLGLAGGLSATGNVTVLGGNALNAGNSSVSTTKVSTPKLNQSAAGSFGTRAALVGGSYTFTYPTAYTSVPICVAVPEGTLSLGLIQVAPTTTACVVTSAVGTDTRTVDIMILGNPN